jgi:hypothetical protein
LLLSTIFFFFQFATDPDTLKTLTSLMRKAVPPHCSKEGSGVADLSLGSHCLACIKAVLEKGKDLEDFAVQARDSQLASCLLQFLEWDHTSSSGRNVSSSSEDYTNINNGLAEDGKVSLRVYSVSVIKMLLQNDHSVMFTQRVISEHFTNIWAVYKEQSLDLFVTETERRRLLLGDVVANFLTNE